jgi:hypothetical protein
MTKSKSQVLKEGFYNKFYKPRGIEGWHIEGTIFDIWSFFSKSLTSEYKRGFRTGAGIKSKYSNGETIRLLEQAHKEGYKRGREEGLQKYAMPKTSKVLSKKQ